MPNLLDQKKTLHLLAGLTVWLFACWAFSQETGGWAAEPGITETVFLLHEELDDAEANGTSFDPRLGELSFDLGAEFAALGLHEEALEAFQRADQNMKVREGLYSENREIPIRKIYEQQLKLNNRAEAEQALNTIAWIKARNYDANSLAYVPVLQELTLWNLAEDAQERDDDRGLYLLSAHSNLEKIYRIYQKNQQSYDSKTLDLLTAINYRLALHGVMNENFSRLREQQVWRQVEIAAQACQRQFRQVDSAERCMDGASYWVAFNTPEANSGVSEHQTLGNTQQLSALQEFYSSQSWQVTEIDNSIELNNNPDLIFFTHSYYRGKELLLDQLDALTESDDKDAALQTLLALGNWYLLFGYMQSASEVYASAWSFATHWQLQALVDMKMPSPISTTALETSYPKLQTGNRQGYLKASLLIAPTGEVGRVDIVQTDIENERVLAELLADLSMSRYRPALDQGVPVAGMGYVIEREVLY